MDENLYDAERKVCRYPPEPFYYPGVDRNRFPANGDIEYYYCFCYRKWFCNEIINNRFLMFNVFIRKIPHAILLFEEIINSYDFFKYVICQTEKFNSLRRVFNLAGAYIISDTFTEYIIIPAMWNKYLPKIFDAEFDPSDDNEDFFL